MDCELMVYYRNSPYIIQNIDNQNIFIYEKGSYIIFNGEVFNFEKFSFNIPSVHKIDDKSNSAELLLYHKSIDSVKTKILIISVLIKEKNDVKGPKQTILKNLVNSIPEVKDIELEIEDKINIYDLLPINKSFYTYQGSLLTHPCTENVKWIIFDKNIFIQTDILNNFKNKIPLNSLRTKNLNEIIVFYNLNDNIRKTRNFGTKLICNNEYENEYENDSQNTPTDNNTNIKYYILITSLFISLVSVLILIILKKYKKI